MNEDIEDAIHKAVAWAIRRLVGAALVGSLVFVGAGCVAVPRDAIDSARILAAAARRNVEDDMAPTCRPKARCEALAERDGALADAAAAHVERLEAERGIGPWLRGIGRGIGLGAKGPE